MRFNGDVIETSQQRDKRSEILHKRIFLWRSLIIPVVVTRCSPLAGTVAVGSAVAVVAVILVVLATAALKVITTVGTSGADATLAVAVSTNADLTVAVAVATCGW